jgi:flap endonuclease-1
MGIKQLSKVIAENAPRAVSEHPLQHYFGRKVAIDASMSIYQFLIAVRTEQGALTNASGSQTSHLIGLFYRTLRLLEHGLKPIYVFDGSPPKLKSGELAKRSGLRAAAAASLEDAKERGDDAGRDKFERRLVKVTPQHVQECQQLLDALGVPWLQAPGEAEAQCAALVRQGLAYGVASEDMDTLTFGAPVMLRHVTASEAKKLPIAEYSLNDVLKGFQLTMEQFIDLCILLGCDYCDTIKGIGPMRALLLLKQCGSIEKVIDSLEEDKRPPADWPFEEARRLFIAPDVLPDRPTLEWKPPSVDAVLDLLVRQHGFNDKRVSSALERIAKANTLGSQKRMDDFFKVLPSNDGDGLARSEKKPLASCPETKENGKHLAKKPKRT